MKTKAELLNIYNLWVTAHSDEYEQLSAEDKSKIFELLKGNDEK